MKFNYRMADRVISVDSHFEQVHRLCKDYLTEDPADFAVSVNAEEIEKEREKAVREDLQEGRTPRTWGDPYLEELAVYRKIAEKMPEYDTVLIHGSAVAVDGSAYLFTAKSGTGKSTHTKLWREQFGERAVMINDDKPLLYIGPDRAVIYGTPYNGKHRIGTNTSAPLKAICFLVRGQKNKLRPLTSGEIFPRIWAQVYRPADAFALRRTLELLNRLTGTVSFYELSCNMDPEAAVTAYEGMNPEAAGTQKEETAVREGGTRAADQQF